MAKGWEFGMAQNIEFSNQAICIFAGWEIGICDRFE